MSLNSWFYTWPFAFHFFRLVTPGQLATFKLAPVNALKRVVLPQFGIADEPYINDITHYACTSITSI